MVPINLYDSLTFTPLLPRATPRLEASASEALRWSGGVPPDSSAAARLPLVDGVALECCWAGATDPTTELGTLPPPSENLVTRAAILLRRRAGVAAGATIRLVKRIPSAAGLGGGSSDAAATLLAGNLAWKTGWPLARLAELAAELGSDVPFFLTSRTAICRGRGERVEPLACPSRLHAVVVRPPAGLSTAEVYARCRTGSLPHSVQPAARALAQGNLRQLGRAIYNRLEKPAAELSAWIGRLREELSHCGCVAAQMSGSGTSYFGLCHHAAHARHVAGRLRCRDVGQVYAVRGC